MELFFMEFLVRVTLLIASVVVILRIGRVKDAAAKHLVWTGVLALMLVVPVWTAWGPKAHLRILPAPGPTLASGSRIADVPLQTVTQRNSSFLTRDKAVAIVYVSGLLLLLFRLGIGTVRARRLARDVVLVGNLRVSSRCSAPVTVGFFRPIAVLPENWRHWSDDQLKAVLTHENEHVRRRDSLVQWVAQFNRALFWFHPAAWWLEKGKKATGNP